MNVFSDPITPENFGWEHVVQTIAINTPLTAGECAVFSEQVLGDLDLDPLQLCKMVISFFVTATENPGLAVADLIRGLLDHE